MSANGPGFISLQVRDLEASAAFYEQQLGLLRAQNGPPHAVVFDTAPAAFAVRDIAPGVDLSAAPQPGLGVGIWLHAPNTQAIHEALVASGTPIVVEPFEGPFGQTFAFADPDGYTITLHSRA
ncbi:VOC family protein [Agromyces sp. Soil535]|uniref:VOC family protein n=1 Tax=Agromyces sp. Soil535 TaxID=1736390 RepID=UPI0006FA65D5|nr:VOC family protein [Agromyces sp. Soil535]KRE23451.1 glyoxalase [Agromyces sp. Soil535]